VPARSRQTPKWDPQKSGRSLSALMLCDSLSLTLVPEALGHLKFTFLSPTLLIRHTCSVEVRQDTTKAGDGVCIGAFLDAALGHQRRQQGW
jgi:hypothetical protein